MTDETPAFVLNATIKTDDHPDGAAVRVEVYGPDLLTAVRGLVQVGNVDTAAQVLQAYMREDDDVDLLNGDEG